MQSVYGQQFAAQERKKLRPVNNALGNNSIMTKIRPFFDRDHPAILDLANSLSEWFDDDALTRAIPVDLQHQQVLWLKQEAIS